MEAIPMEWVDKIFTLLAEWYGDRWSKMFNKPHMESFYKGMWKNGLTGVTEGEIKNALRHFKNDATYPHHFPPHVMEFFRVAKPKACQPKDNDEDNVKPFRR